MGWKDLPHWVKVGFVLSFVFLFFQIVKLFLPVFGVVDFTTNWVFGILTYFFKLSWCQLSDDFGGFARYCNKLTLIGLFVGMGVNFLIGAVFGWIYWKIKGKQNQQIN